MHVWRIGKQQQTTTGVLINRTSGQGARPGAEVGRVVRKAGDGASPPSLRTGPPLPFRMSTPGSFIIAPLSFSIDKGCRSQKTGREAEADDTLTGDALFEELDGEGCCGPRVKLPEVVE